MGLNTESTYLILFNEKDVQDEIVMSLALNQIDNLQNFEKP